MADLISVRDLVKNYTALRPLRIAQLTVRERDIVSLVGLDAPAAELLVGLLTGALLPDSGEVTLFEKSTREVADPDAWLAMLDGVGIISERAVLIQRFSVEQNIAMPFTLDVDPVPPEVKTSVTQLAREVGLDESLWHAAVGGATPETVLRVRLARALALGPKVVLAEHPSADLPRDAVARVGNDVARLAARRGIAVLAITADEAFARALGGQLLRHQPATGALRPEGTWRKLFGG